jgi:hypothetical protein
MQEQKVQKSGNKNYNLKELKKGNFCSQILRLYGTKKNHEKIK